MAGIGNMNVWFSDSEDDEREPRRARTFRPRINFDFGAVYEYNERFRMSFEKLTNLVERLEPVLRRASERNHALSAKNCVQIALHWLGNGGQYHAVSDMHGISKATVCRIIRQFVTAVNNTLFNELVTWPDNVADVVQKFYELGGLPLVCGCIDGTLIKIDAPRENEEAFVDRHGNHSINCMAVCGPDLTFYYVDANWPGRVHDARILRNSSLFQRMQNGWRPVPDGIILGDSGYPSLPWLIPPTERNRDNVA